MGPQRLLPYLDDRRNKFRKLVTACGVGVSIVADLSVRLVPARYIIVLLENMRLSTFGHGRHTSRSPHQRAGYPTPILVIHVLQNREVIRKERWEQLTKQLRLNSSSSIILKIPIALAYCSGRIFDRKVWMHHLSHGELFSDVAMIHVIPLFFPSTLQ